MIRRLVLAVSSVALAPMAFALVSGTIATTTKTTTTTGIVQLPASPKLTPAPTPTPTPTATAVTSTTLATTATVATAPVLAKLAPLDLSQMWIWYWDGKWLASEWNNGFSQTPWKYDRVIRQTGGDVKFKLDSAGAPQLQALNGTPGYTRGLWEVEATLPALREGMVVAPLWLYEGNSKDEIDFEFVGKKGLDVSIHAYPGGVHKQDTVRLFAGTDMSGKRMRFGIKLDETAGTASMLIDGKVVHSWSKAKLGWFVTKPVKPIIEMWAANPQLSWLTAWTGVWTPLPAGDSRTMTVHGYGYTPIP